MNIWGKTQADKMIETQNHQPAANADLDADGWLDAYGGFLFRYAKSRVRNDSVAEDLVQETFLAGLKSKGSFQGQSSEKNWLVGILRNKILEYFRKRSKELPSSLDDLARDSHVEWFDAEGHWNRETDVAGMNWEPDPSATLDRKEFWAVLQQCIDQLPERAAAAFVQRDMEHQTSTEVIDNLSISEANLWVLLHRARNQLRLCLQANWFNRPEKEVSR